MQYRTKSQDRHRFPCAGLANAALALFLVAAAGGAYMNLEYHWKMLPLPKWLVLVHAAIAVAAYLLLLAATFASRT